MRRTLMKRDYIQFLTRNPRTKERVWLLNQGRKLREGLPHLLRGITLSTRGYPRFALDITSGKRGSQDIN
jgi:hypothetical protein